MSAETQAHATTDAPLPPPPLPALLMTPSLVRPLQLALATVVLCCLAHWSQSLRGLEASQLSAVRETTDLASASHPHCVGDDRSEKSSFFDYEHLVYCTSLRDSLPLARTVLVLLLVVLLYLLSSTADSFFCPVLQAIVEKYRIPPDIAGVTFLSFGNGSPDVFSNIAAFSTATPKMAVASILGGGLLVTTVIAASVGLASQDQDQLIPRKFIRDVLFYLVAIAYFCFVFFNGTVGLAEALGFLAIYACYVITILFDSKIARLYYHLVRRDFEELENYETLKHLPHYFSSSSRSSSCHSVSSLDDHASSSGPEIIKAYDVFRIPNYTSPSDSEDSSSSLQAPPLFRKTSAPTPKTGKLLDSGYDTPSPRESAPLLWRQLTTVKRPATVCIPSLARTRKRSRKRTAWESTQMSAHFNLTAKRWTRGYHELSGIAEFSSVSETGDEVEEAEVDASERAATVEIVEAISAWDRYIFRWFRVTYQVFERYIWSPLELSTTFIRRLTIPLIDDETWDKSFAMVCPPAAVLIIGISIFELNPIRDIGFAVSIIAGGGAGSVFVYFTASPITPPEGLFLAPYICLGFIMSVIWIMNIANEVLALLKVLGSLFGISNSVLGVSVLAWGNSIGDLVSNTSIARDGFPTMAFAGCFAGPMFNLLVGIGLALTIAIVSRGPISMGSPSALVYVGFGFLFASLVLNLVFAACDRFRYRPRLCYSLLVLYVMFVAISIAVVIAESE